MYTAHPAKFSPDDKYAPQRIQVKKRFNILPTQLPLPEMSAAGGQPQEGTVGRVLKTQRCIGCCDTVESNFIREISICSRSVYDDLDTF